MIKTLLLIGAGGALGSICRYLLAQFTTKTFSTIFPIGTFAVNVLGCFLVGIIITLLLKFNLQDSNYKLFLIAGFSGGFTTFSAFTLENIQLIQNGNISTAILYIASSIIISLIALYLGTQLAQLLS